MYVLYGRKVNMSDVKYWASSDFSNISTPGQHVLVRSGLIDLISSDIFMDQNDI